jgi:peptidoglycan-associated lipoprotein
MLEKRCLKIIILISLVFAFASAGCTIKKKGTGISGDAAVQDKMSSKIEDVEVEGSGITSGLTPEQQRRIEEEELAERQRLAAEESMTGVDSFMMTDIFFDFDRSELGAEARETLNELAGWLAVKTAIKLKIEGHADERGTSEYNLALGARRAETVKRYLMNLGIEEARLSTISYGEEMPVTSEQSEEAWAKNRRAHFEAR